MITSKEGIAAIKLFEGFRAKAYDDGGGVWTIGYGHTGPDVRPGRVISQREGEIILAKDLAKFEAGVARLVKVPLNPDEFDALVSFSFNVGLDEDTDKKAEGLGDSTLLFLLNMGQRRRAAEEFGKWKFDNGRIKEGLIRRRRAEKAMFLSRDWRAEYAREVVV